MAKLIVGQNDLATTHPELAKEWHPTKNGTLKPTDVSAGTVKRVWWLFPYDDQKTGKHFDFEWDATINDRNHPNIGCPYLSGRAVWPGFNDLATTHPKLAKEWHPTKNAELKPTDVTAGSQKKVWWILPYDDPKTGKHFDFEWEARIYDRVKFGCPYLSGRAVWNGFNDLATTHPELAKEWHPTKNGNLKPTDVTGGANKKVWWLLPYDDPETGKHFDFEWQSTIKGRTSGMQCPYLSGRAVWAGFNDFATTHPEFAKQWHPTKNGNLKPTGVTSCSSKKVWWFLPYDDPKTGKHFDFEWEASVKNRSKGCGCPYLFVSKGENLITKTLNKNKFYFERERKNNDLIYKRNLFFDFFVNNSCAIEYDGAQHFKPVEYFGGIKYFNEIKTRDNIKNKYCFDNNIPLLRIPYTYDPVVNKDKIESLVLNFVKMHKVPKEILNFYKKQKNNNYYTLFAEKNIKKVA